MFDMDYVGDRQGKAWAIWTPVPPENVEDLVGGPYYKQQGASEDCRKVKSPWHDKEKNIQLDLAHH